MGSKEENKLPKLEVEMLEKKKDEKMLRFMYRFKDADGDMVEWIDGEIEIEKQSKMKEQMLRSYRDCCGKQLEEVKIIKMKVMKA